MALVFISYSRRDETFVKKLVADLRQQNVPVWLDQNNIPVEVYHSLIENVNEIVFQADPKGTILFAMATGVYLYTRGLYRPLRRFALIMPWKLAICIITNK